MNKNDRIPALDGLRGLAAFLVVLSHAGELKLFYLGPQIIGGIGVMLFFSLSGFLIGHLYLNQQFTYHSCIKYISSRVGRIMPVYYAVIILSMMLSVKIGKNYIFHISTFDFMRLLLFSSGKYIFWSIPPEIQFYIVFLFIWCGFSSGGLTQWIPLLLMALAIVILANPLFPGSTFAAQAHIFLAGVGASLIRNKLPHSNFNEKGALFVQLIGFSVIILTATEIFPSRNFLEVRGLNHNYNFYPNIPITIMCASFVLSCTRSTWLSKLLFENKVSKTLGNYSFSLYLMHEPVMLGVHNLLDRTEVSLFLQTLLGIAASIGLSALSYKFLEMPSQKALRSFIINFGSIGITKWKKSVRPM